MLQAEVPILDIADRAREPHSAGAACSDFTQLFEQAYPRIRELAAGMFRHERRDHTLQATALTHEAFVKMLNGLHNGGAPGPLQSKSHFYAAAAHALRQVLVDHARRHNRQKRGRGFVELRLDQLDGRADHGPDVVELDDLLQTLARQNPRQAQAIEMTVYGGMTLNEIAQALSVSPRTVSFDLRHARAWLHRALSELQ